MIYIFLSVKQFDVVMRQFITRHGECTMYEAAMPKKKSLVTVNGGMTKNIVQWCAHVHGYTL